MTAQDISRPDNYVYALFREDGITPFYIGKGRGNRMFIHARDAHKGTTHKDHIIQRMLAAGLSVHTAKICDGLTNTQAMQIEVDLIQLIGRWPKVPLANLTRGGDGGDVSAETRQKHTAHNKKSWADPVVREKRVNGMRAVWTAEKRAEHAEKAQRRNTPQYREKLRAGALAAYNNADYRAKRAESDKLGAIKKSDSMKKAWADPEIRARRTEASRKSQSDPAYKEKRSKLAKEIWAKRGITESQAAAKEREKRENPNYAAECRARRVAAQKASFSTPEAKARRSEASKKMWAAKKAQTPSLDQ